MYLRATVISVLILFLSIHEVGAQVKIRSKFKIHIAASNHELAPDKYYRFKGYLVGMTDSSLTIANSSFKNPMQLGIHQIKRIEIKRKGAFGWGFLTGFFTPIIVTAPMPEGSLFHPIVAGIGLALPSGIVGGIIAFAINKEKFVINYDINKYLQIKPELEKYLVEQPPPENDLLVNQ